MSHIQCFFLEPTVRAQVNLRRYRDSHRYLKNEDGSYKTEKRGDEQVIIIDSNYDGTCKKGNYSCEAAVTYGECDYSERSVMVTDEMKLDPAWPKACECGYVFRPDDHWQWNENRLYKRSDNGEMTIIGTVPVGAMWNASWLQKYPDYKKRPDGIVLVVRTPGGDWCVDGPSNNGNGWERTGLVPDITATPSILMTRYHGWLQKGVLVAC